MGRDRAEIGVIATPHPEAITIAEMATPTTIAGAPPARSIAPREVTARQRPQVVQVAPEAHLAVAAVVVTIVVQDVNS